MLLFLFVFCCLHVCRFVKLELKFAVKSIRLSHFTDFSELRPECIQFDITVGLINNDYNNVNNHYYCLLEVVYILLIIVLIIKVYI